MVTVRGERKWTPPCADCDRVCMDQFYQLFIYHHTRACSECQQGSSGFGLQVKSNSVAASHLYLVLSLESVKQ